MFKMKVDSEPFSLIHFYGISLRDKLLNIINSVNAFEKNGMKFLALRYFFYSWCLKVSLEMVTKVT